MTLETIEQIKSYIQDHIKEPITNIELAKKFSYTKQSIMIYFRKYEGVSLHRYVIRAKMHKAKEYLEEGYCAYELPIMLGYNNNSAFRKVFKQEFGETPKRLEMRLRK